MSDQTNTDAPIPNAAVGQPNLRGTSFLPEIVPRGGNLDPEIQAAWKEHIVEGFKQNSQMFNKLLDAFLRPYWLTVWMYRVMFTVGILGFIAAAALGVTRGVEFAVIFGGLSAISFLSFFVSQPLRALEQNIQFITWLGIIYNTYWTRLMYANDNATIQQDLDAIVTTAVSELKQLIDKYGEASGKRPSFSSSDGDQTKGK